MTKQDLGSTLGNSFQSALSRALDIGADIAENSIREEAGVGPNNKRLAEENDKRLESSWNGVFSNPFDFSSGPKWGAILFWGTLAVIAVFVTKKLLKK